MVGSVTDVLVVGAGPAGLTLAAEVAAFGVQPRLIDCALDRVHESRALAIQPRTLEVLARLGVTDELIACGNPAVQLRVHARGRVVAVPMFDLGLDDTAYPHLLFLSQATTERILGEYLATAGVLVERGVELVGLSNTADAAVATLRHRDGREEAVHARYVAGCDGAHSTVRRLAGIAFEGSSYPQTFVLTDASADGVEAGAAHVFLSDRGMLFFFPLGQPAPWRLLAMRPPGEPTPAADPTPHGDRTPVGAPVTLDEVQALADTYTGGAVRLHDPVWMTNFRLHHRAAAHYRAGRVFLAGDAAHIHSPAGAQGMNTGIQDAVNLGWKLAQTLGGRSDQALLDTYEAERAPIGTMVLRFTDRAFTIATSTNPAVRFARTRLAPAMIPLALKARPVRAYAFRTVSQLGIRYRDSALSVDGPDPPPGGPKPGDRLPDASIAGQGQPSTLHRALAATGWHLLLCGPPDVWPAPAITQLAERYAGLVTVHHLTARNAPGALHDPNRQALRRLGITASRGAQYLVRPDGHVGYRTGGSDIAGLAGYLGRWLSG